MLENYNLIINEELIKERLKELKKSKESKDKNPEFKIWEFGNKILYDMCKENLKHDSQEIIAGKIWIIGRCYAAAIERRRKNKEENEENLTEFFINKVIPKMLDKHVELDERIEKILKFDNIDENNVDYILKTHKLLTEIFYSITNQKKRSLASKYLHFHCPNAFFIYDGIAKTNISKLVKKPTGKATNEEYDTEYPDFCYRALILKKYIESKTDYKLTPRDIDNILYYENKNKNKSTEKL
jgi:hypothetical protein